MRVNVFVRDYITKAGEKRYYLIVREAGRKDQSIQLGPVSRKLAGERRLMVLNELLNGVYQRVSEVRPYFGEFCDKFVAEFARGTRAPSTVVQYEYNLGLVKKVFQGWRLDGIRREDLEKFIGERPVGNRAKNIMLSVLRVLFQKAVDWRYLAKAPTEGIKRWREEKGGSRSLTMQELARVLEAAFPWARSVVRVMVHSGMRSGELVRLKFRDIDWEAQTLTVVSDRERKTKTRKSRVIPLSPELEQELRFLRENWPNMQYGSGDGDVAAYLPRTDAQRDYVFCHRNGKPVATFRRSLTKCFRKVGLQGVTPHGLRKTFCTLLARHGVHPKTAQRLMGHSDVRLTMDVYTEVDTEQMRQAVHLLPSLRDVQRERLRVVGGE